MTPHAIPTEWARQRAAINTALAALARGKHDDARRTLESAAATVPGPQELGAMPDSTLDFTVAAGALMGAIISEIRRKDPDALGGISKLMGAGNPISLSLITGPGICDTRLESLDNHGGRWLIAHIPGNPFPVEFWNRFEDNADLN